jgi:hypothetical protein
VVTMQGQAVHAEREREQVQMLACVTNRVRPPKPERVVECTVDRLSVIAPLVQTGEVRIGGRDGPDVFGAVEPALVIVGVAVQPDRRARTTVTGRTTSKSAIAKRVRSPSLPLQLVHVAGTHEFRGFSPTFRAGPASVGPVGNCVWPGSSCGFLPLGTDSANSGTDFLGSVSWARLGVRFCQVLSGYCL